MELTFDIKSMIAPEFLPMWWTNCPTRYRVLYGARNTGKSYTFLGLEILHKLLFDKRRNVCVFRAVANDLKDTCFAEIKKALYRTGLWTEFQIKEHDIEIVHKKTRQKILFFGCDRGTAVNGIQVESGEITDFYFEEAFELKDYELFRQIDGSLRGEFATYIPKSKIYIPQQCTFLLNPRQSFGCWIYDIFIKNYLPDTENTQKFLENVGYRIKKLNSLSLEKGIGLALMQSTYKVNKWRAQNYDQIAQAAKLASERIYNTEFLGMWGATGEIVYPEFKDNLILPANLMQELSFSEYCIGIDTGYSNGEGKILQGNSLDSARIKSAYVIILCGITRTDYSGVEKGSIVAIDEYYYSKEILTSTQRALTPQELQEQTVNTILSWFSKYQSNPTLFRSMCNVFVDSADAGTLSSLQTIQSKRKIMNLRFSKSSKRPILTRIRFSNKLMAYKKMYFSSECKNLIREIKSSREGKGTIRENVNDHAINAWEYGTIPFYNLAKEWQNFKEY